MVFIKNSGLFADWPSLISLKQYRGNLASSCHLRQACAVRLKTQIPLFLVEHLPNLTRH